MEKWKYIPGFSGAYQISSEGRVRSFWRKQKRRGIIDKTGEGHIMRPTSNGRGYLGVNLTNLNRRRRRRYIHDLVARAFIGAPPTKRHEVNHDDGNKSNNAVGNLEWLTRKKNHEHRFETLGHKNENKKGRFGSRHPRAKRYLITFPGGQKEIIHGLSAFCRAHDLLQSSMSEIISGKLKQHKGFLCERVESTAAF